MKPAAMHKPTLSDCADAVAEMASREIEVVEGMKHGTYCPPDAAERVHIEWRAQCLVAAHCELRALIRVSEMNDKARRRATG